jgi:hypothetical protein
MNNVANYLPQDRRRALARGVYEKVLATTRAALSEEAFAAGWAEGERWSLEEAVAYALEETADSD